MKRKHRLSDDGLNFWQPASDMFSALMMILMLVIANLMEATLMYYRFFTEGVFFLICGIITYRVKEKK